jgi:hypothetical protein
MTAVVALVPVAAVVAAGCWFQAWAAHADVPGLNVEPQHKEAQR